MITDQLSKNNLEKHSLAVIDESFCVVPGSVGAFSSMMKKE